MRSSGSERASLSRSGTASERRVTGPLTIESDNSILCNREERNESDVVDVWPSKNGFAWKIPRGETTEYGVMSDVDRAKEISEMIFYKNPLKIFKLEGKV